MQAVVFDLGGVVLESPIPVIAAIEREHGIAGGGLVQVLVGPEAAFTQLMRGRIDVAEFDRRLAAATAALGERPVSGRRMLERLEEAVVVRPRFLAAAQAIRAAGRATGVITNNWEKLGKPDAQLAGHFDVFVESWVVGVVKPDPRIYLQACARLGIPPHEIVFLDDFGENLAAARDLGMRTILVRDPDDALEELGDLLGMALVGRVDAGEGA